MRELNEHEIKCAAGGQDYGREIAQGAGAGAAAGTFVVGGGYCWPYRGRNGV